jgi:hypothetical protein
MSGGAPTDIITNVPAAKYGFGGALESADIAWHVTIQALYRDLSLFIEAS